MMRVLLLPSSYPPVLGGLQTVAHTLARHLLDYGYQVQVVTNRYPRHLAAQEVLDNVPVQRWLFLRPDVDQVRRNRPDLVLASFYFYPMTLMNLHRLVRGFRPDVVNVHFPDAQVPFVLWLRRHFDFRLVVSLHGDEIERWFGEGRTLDGRTTDARRFTPGSFEQEPVLIWLKSILKEADAVTACSQHLLEQAIQLEPSVGSKACVIHNGVDPRRYEDKTPYPHPRPYILAYGRLTYKKGFDLLLQAFAQVASAHPQVDLLLAGDGEQGPALRLQAEQLSLNGRVRFLGEATPAQISRLLNGCLLVVVPSRRESFGIVALEALAAGKPILATRVGGLPEFLDAAQSIPNDVQRLGIKPPTLLVEPTAEALSTALAEWLRLADRGQLGTVSNSHILNAFAWEGVADAYARVLKGQAG